MTTAEALVRGRESFERQAWGAAFALLSEADRENPLEPDDLERLATIAFLVGQDEASDGYWTRAHHELLSRKDIPGAVRCAFWLGFGLINRAEFAQAMGWFGRAQRLLEDEQIDCVERGYLLLPAAIPIAGSDPKAALAMFTQAVEIGERFGEPDLVGESADGLRTMLDQDGKSGRRTRAARRSHGRRHSRRAVGRHGGGRLLRRYRSVFRGLRHAPRARVDRRASPVVRVSAGSHAVPRPVPRAPRRDHADARFLAGRSDRGAPRMRASGQAPDARVGLLSTGRAASRSRRFRRSRRGIRSGERVGA